MARLGFTLTFCLFVLAGRAEALPTTIAGSDAQTGQAVSLASSEKAPLVVLFLSSKCPCSLSHVNHLIELKKKFSQFSFVGIFSGPEETEDKVKSVLGPMGLNFPLLVDADQKWLNQFEALKTPHVFVVNQKGEVVFAGGVSDSSSFAASEKHYLEVALTELSEGRSLTRTEAKALGCYIQRK